MSLHWNTAAFVRLIIVFVSFPVFFVYLLPQLEFASAFFRGDRSQWLPFWAASAAFEWIVLILVLLAFARQRDALAEVGVPRAGPGTLLVTAVIVGAAVWAAVALPGMSDEALARTPGAMFLPPADTGSRLFWVFMCATAAICEEILWRGVAITQLRKLTGSLWIAVPICALAFAFYHGGVDQGWAAFGVRFALALVLSGLFIWRKSLTSAMLVHFLLDASALAAM